MVGKRKTAMAAPQRAASQRALPAKLRDITSYMESWNLGAKRKC